MRRAHSASVQYERSSGSRGDAADGAHGDPSPYAEERPADGRDRDQRHQYEDSSADEQPLERHGLILRRVRVTFPNAGPANVSSPRADRILDPRAQRFSRADLIEQSSSEAVIGLAGHRQ